MRNKSRVYTFDLADGWNKDVSCVSWEGQTTLMLEFGTERKRTPRKTLRIVCPIGAATRMLIDGLREVVARQRAEVDRYELPSPEGEP